MSPRATAAWATGVLVVFSGASAAVGWCEAQVLYLAGVRHRLSTWTLPFLGAFTLLLALLVVMYASEIRDLFRGWSLHWPFQRAAAPPATAGPTPAPPPPDPETLAFQAKHAAALHELRAAIARGACPACGAGGFSGAETYSHSVDGFARDGRGFVGGTVYEVWGRCLACGHAPKIPFMR